MFERQHPSDDVYVGEVSNAPLYDANIQRFCPQSVRLILCFHYYLLTLSPPLRQLRWMGEQLVYGTSINMSVQSYSHLLFMLKQKVT